MPDVTTKPASIGGHHVVRSLQRAGFQVNSNDCALFETRKPRWVPFGSVLVQNAWNLIDNRLFAQHLGQYPQVMRPRILARRLVAQYNLKRARTVVCFTEEMAERAASIGCHKVSVRSVAGRLPESFEVGEGSFAKPASRVLVVPGTVTWYKRPSVALDVLGALGADPREWLIVLAGARDRSGCAEAIERQARTTGWRLVQRSYSQEEMAALLETADIVLTASAFEALDLTFLEAVASARCVISSDIAAHKEAAHHLNATVNWLHNMELPLRRSCPVRITHADLRRQWRALGTALELEPIGPVQ